MDFLAGSRGCRLVCIVLCIYIMVFEADLLNMDLLNMVTIHQSTILEGNLRNATANDLVYMYGCWAGIPNSRR